MAIQEIDELKAEIKGIREAIQRLRVLKGRWSGSVGSNAINLAMVDLQKLLDEKRARMPLTSNLG